MNTSTRLLSLSLLLTMSAAVASANIIHQDVFADGNISAFSVPGSGSTSASQFNETATNAAVQASCPAGYTCSAVTLDEIDFTLTANTSATVSVDNGNGTTSYVESINGDGGTFSNPNSGIALQQVTTITLTDPLSNIVDEVIPTFSQATNTEGLKNLTSTPCQGTATSGNFVNCLSVAPGTHVFSGTGTDTEAGSYTSGQLTSSVLTAYVGSGNVSFTLSSSGAETNGTLLSNVSIPTNSATVQNLTNALQIEYKYSYDEEPVTTPEPATFLLLGTALVGLAVGLKRRQHKA